MVRDQRRSRKPLLSLANYQPAPLAAPVDVEESEFLPSLWFQQSEHYLTLDALFAARKARFCRRFRRGRVATMTRWPASGVHSL